ncbi:MAG: hypothetical protein QXK08_03325 [Candidatus Woesearchaeota archaeon]
METVDFDRIRKLPPERKIKVLRELQEKLADFIKERSEEIAKSQQEIKDAQDFLKEAEEELRVLEEMQERAPGIKKVDVEKLFKPAKKKGRGLESIAEEDAPKAPPTAAEHDAYISRLAQMPVSDIYERIRAIGNEIRTTGTISPYQQQRLEMFGEALQEKEEAIREGRYEPGRKAEALLTAAERAISYAKGERQYKTR